MSVKALAEYIRITKYARYLPEEQRRETWVEQVDRVFNMHEEKYAYCIDRIKPYLDEARAAMKKKLVLGSQRALQFGGQAILDQHSRMYNCSFSHANRPRFFGQAMFMLLSGSGVGFSVQYAHVNQLPDVKPRVNGDITYTVPDTIEGWSDAITVIMSSYFDVDLIGFEQYRGKKVSFDYSQIRPAGAMIKSTGHKAPGPDILRNSIDRIEQIMNRVVETEGRTRLDPIDVYDVTMFLADAVVSGGSRRSATICLFSPNDDKMMKAKTGDWFYSNPQRGRSNNSVVLLRNETTREQWAEIMTSVREFGEPGFAFVDDINFGTNPCFEIGLDCIDDRGNSGFGTCNLTEQNGKKHKTKEDFMVSARASAIIGTVQAGYTSFPYMYEPELGYNPTEEIIRRDALLGCSITGIQEVPDINLDPEILKEAAHMILEVNAEVADVIGINTAARLTCTKPSGTSSLLLGTSSGIHPHHAKRYFRRVQANKLENPLQFFKLWNPDAVEESVWSANKTDEVITFLCEVPEGARFKNSHGAIALLNDVKLYQQNWVMNGMRPNRSRIAGMNHNISNTITVKDAAEWADVEEYIFQNRNYFTGISLLSLSGDSDYPQAPFQTVYTAKAIQKHYGDGSLFASGLIVDGLKAFSNLWEACDAINGFGITEENASPEQSDWIRRARKFATNYFAGNVREMSYCLKEVHSNKMWHDLSRTYSDVPWSDMVELAYNAKSATDESATACSGGACEVV